MASSLAAEQDLLNKAIKQEKSAAGGFSFFGGRTEKYEKAVEMYRSAANAYRIKLTQLDDSNAILMATEQAGSALEAAARISTDNLEEPLDAVNIYTEAFKLYHDAMPEKAAWAMQEAITRQKQLGRWRPAATNSETLAKHYKDHHETWPDNTNIAKAIDAYRDTLKCYRQDPAPALENKITLALAELQATMGDYQGAIDNFETAADKAQSSNLLAWSIKNYLFSAGLCHLATGDMVAVTRAFEGYQRNYNNQFVSTKEFELLQQLKDDVEKGDLKAYVSHIQAYKDIVRFEKWQQDVAVVIQGKIEATEESWY